MEAAVFAAPLSAYTAVLLSDTANPTWNAAREDLPFVFVSSASLAAGGLATPADAALMMQLGVDGVFVGSGIFKSEDPAPRARAIVEATTHFQDPDALAKVSRGLGEPMPGLDIKELGEEGLLQTRGW